MVYTTVKLQMLYFNIWLIYSSSNKYNLECLISEVSFIKSSLFKKTVCLETVNSQFLFQKKNYV